MNSHDLDELAQYLKDRSKEICADNDCDIENDEHNCESYAYFDVKWCGQEIASVSFVDICCPDYLQRTVDCAIRLPFTGDSGKDLLDEIESEADYNEEQAELNLIEATKDKDLPTLEGKVNTAEGKSKLEERLKGEDE